MRYFQKSFLGLAILFAAILASGKFATSSAFVATDEPAATETSDDAPKDAAVERARREVQMIDTIYKTSIVLITEHYVNNEDELPAGEAFINRPKEGFEQTAVKKLVAGEAVYDEVVTENGKRFLNSATAIPVVMKKCIMCHDNYEGSPNHYLICLSVSVRSTFLASAQSASRL